MISNPIYGKIKNGNQTTNQIVIDIVIVSRNVFLFGQICQDLPGSRDFLSHGGTLSHPC